jgi:hypothetical protein
LEPLQVGHIVEPGVDRGEIADALVLHAVARIEHLCGIGVARRLGESDCGVLHLAAFEVDAERDLEAAAASMSSRPLSD